jgi:hypothetical protein
MGSRGNLFEGYPDSSLTSSFKAKIENAHSLKKLDIGMTTRLLYVPLNNYAIKGLATVPHARLTNLHA